jgi:5'-methylthioadenosine phosphorylase
MKLEAEIGIVARPDEFLKQYNFKQHKLNTDNGEMDRLFLGNVDGRKVAVIYGRFNERRVPSWDIDFEKNQMTFNALGVKTILGAFVTGSIQDKYKIGDVFIVDDFVGMGGYKKSLYKKGGFKNVDMYKPFCEICRQALVLSSSDAHYNVHKKGTYACFQGFPRIETKAELEWYQKMGWDIVGQTLDPEATLARESGCCYAAVAVTIDDAKTRKTFLDGSQSARNKIQNAIPEGRKIINSIIFNAIKYLPVENKKECTCGHKFHSEKSHFRHLPDYILGEYEK